MLRKIVAWFSFARDGGREDAVLKAYGLAIASRLDNFGHVCESGEGEEKAYCRQHTPVNHAHRRTDESCNEKNDR